MVNLLAGVASGQLQRLPSHNEEEEHRVSVRGGVITGTGAEICLGSPQNCLVPEAAFGRWLRVLQVCMQLACNARPPTMNLITSI